MGRKKNKKHGKQRQRQSRPQADDVIPEQASPPMGSPNSEPTPPVTARRRSLLVRSLPFVGAVVVGAAALVWSLVSDPGAGSLRPKGNAAVLAGPEFEDFAGAESCEECHEEQYEAWLESTHAKAGGTPETEAVIAPFDGSPMRFADAVVTPLVDEDGRYEFVVRQDGEEPQVVTVAGVIGGGHMEGGGTQGFVTEFPDGTVRFLPFDFSKQGGVWFCNTNSRTDRGWIPIDVSVSLDECADWPPIRILGTESNYANCQECHVAQIDVVFDTSTEMYSTRVTTLAIDCESCHGPMAEHVKRSDPDRIVEEEDIAVDALATLSKNASLQICFRCHALKDVMQPGYFPGKPLLDYYSIGLQPLGESALYPDGRVRTFAYQGNHRYSDCYLNGAMTCVDCHDPHTQQYRDIWGRALDGRFADEQCTDCHPSKAERPEEHTFHEPGAEGSRCIDCHMPYLQHPELGDELRFARSDHTIPIPRPGSDDRMGIVNACALSGCHPDSSVGALEAVMQEWYGELKPRKPIVDALLHFDQLDQAGAAAVLLDSAAGFPAAQVEAVGAFVTRFLTPNMSRSDPSVEQSLRRLARTEDIDLRATALSALHLAWGDNEDTRSFLAETLRGAESALRARWATALGTFGDTYFGSGDWQQAIECYDKALEVRPESAAILMNLGLAQAYAGDHEAAVTSLRRSIALDPRQPLAWVNLGFSLENLGDTPGAERAYRQAVEIKDDEAMAHFNLGNLLFRQGELTQAITHYERALALQPTLVQGHQYLVRAYVAADNIRGAVIAARRWARYAPDDPRPRELLEEVNRAMRRR
jgi:tetratricopeptide (TPR) repeat protein